MSKKEMYKLDIVIGVTGDDKSKEKLRATERFLMRIEKNAKRIDRIKSTPSVRINDQASSKINQIEARTKRIKRVTTGTLRMNDHASSVLDRVSIKRRSAEKDINTTARVSDRASSKINQIETRANNLKKAMWVTIKARDHATLIINKIKGKSKILSKISDMVISAKDKASTTINKVKAKVQNLVAASVISLNIKADPAIRAITLARNKLGDLSKKLSFFSKINLKIPIDIVDKISSKLSTIGSKISSFTKVAVKNFALIVTAVSIATGAVLVGTSKMVNMASDLNESINVVSTTFAESGDQMVAWARTAGAEFGMGTQQVMAFTGQMGAMLKSSGIAGNDLDNMTKSLVGLTGDMSSFYNLPHDEVWQKLRSGIMGETEPLKALGINMSVTNMEAFALSKGINKSWKEMSQAEQVALRYDYIMKQTTDSQGDFAKTAKTLPNQLRSLKNSFIDVSTAIGQVFLPVIEDGLFDATKKFKENYKTIIELLEKGDLEGAMDKLGEAIGEGMLKIGDIIHNMIPVVTKGINSFTKSMIKSAYENFPSFIKGFKDMLLDIRNIIIKEGPNIAKATSQMLEMTITTLEVLLPLFLDIGLQIVMNIISGLIDSAPQIISSMANIISQLATSMSQNMPMIIALGLSLIGAICTGLQQNRPLIIQAAYDLILGIANGVSQNIPLLINVGAQIIDLIVDTIIILLPQIIDLGFRIIDSLAIGLTSNPEAITSALMNLGTTILSALWNLLLTAAEGITILISEVVKGLSFGTIKLPPLDMSLLKISVDEAVNSTTQVPDSIVNGLEAGMPMANQSASKIGTDLSNSMINGLNSGIPQVQAKSSELANAAQNGASSAVDGANSEWATLPQGVDAGFNQASISVQQGATNMYNGAKQSFSGLAEIGRQAGSDLYNGVSASLNKLSTNVKVSASAMYNGASTSFRMLASTGKQEMSNLYNGASNSASQLATNVKVACTNMYNGSKISFSSLSSSAISTITSMCNTVTSKVTTMANTVVSQWNSIRSSVSRPMTASFSITTTQTTVKRAVDGGGNSKSTTKHATGGIFTTPHYALFAEEPGGEAVIPLNDKRRDRAISLWKETGEKLGMNTEDRYRNAGNQSSYFTKANNNSAKQRENRNYDVDDNGSYNPYYGFKPYSPQVTVAGGSDININVEVNNSFDSDIDEEYIIDETCNQVGAKLREALRNTKI